LHSIRPFLTPSDIASLTASTINGQMAVLNLPAHLAKREYVLAGPLRPWNVYELRVPGDV